MADRLVSTMKRTLASFLCSSESFSSSSFRSASAASQSVPKEADEELSPPRKRLRTERYDEDDVAGGKMTPGVGTPPLLVSPAPVDSEALAELLQKKRYNCFNSTRGEECEECGEEQRKEKKGDLLSLLPPEVITDGILSYLGTTSDRFALQTSCKLLRHLSNSPSLLRDLHLYGDTSCGTASGLIADLDTPDSACAKLAKYARAGNHQAIYMLGMIRSYCHGLVEQGASLLKLNSSLGCPRSLYALALILRDSRRSESRSYLSLAAHHKEYLPAWQELLPAPEMKAKYGDLDAKVLQSYLDPPCLNRLLGRHYLYCRAVRGVQTSHCWNPLCGRWAYKATAREPTPTTASQNPLVTTVVDPSQSDSVADTFSDTAHHVEALLYNSSSTSDPTLSAVQQLHFDTAPLQPSLHPTTQPDTSQTTTTTSQYPSSASLTSTTTTNITTKPNNTITTQNRLRVSRMKMCSQCRRAKYCSKLCQVYDWRSGKHKMECQYLRHH